MTLTAKFSLLRLRSLPPALPAAEPTTETAGKAEMYFCSVSRSRGQQLRFGAEKVLTTDAFTLLLSLLFAPTCFGTLRVLFPPEMQFPLLFV